MSWFNIRKARVNRREVLTAALATPLGVAAASLPDSKPNLPAEPAKRIVMEPYKYVHDASSCTAVAYRAVEVKI